MLYSVIRSHFWDVTQRQKRLQRRLRCSTNQMNSKSTQIKSNVGYLRSGENRSRQRKTSQSREKNQQTQPTYDAETGIEPGTHWWKASALANVPTLETPGRKQRGSIGMPLPFHQGCHGIKYLKCIC